MPRYVSLNEAAAKLASANRILVIGCSGGGRRPFPRGLRTGSGWNSSRSTGMSGGCLGGKSAPVRNKGRSSPKWRSGVDGSWTAVGHRLLISDYHKQILFCGSVFPGVSPYWDWQNELPVSTVRCDRPWRRVALNGCQTGSSFPISGISRRSTRRSSFKVSTGMGPMSRSRCSVPTGRWPGC